MIIIQKEIIDQHKFLNVISSEDANIGSIVTFAGIVREFNKPYDENIKAIYIEYFDGMTQSELEKVEVLAKKQWNLKKIIIVHRVGYINVNEHIVFVVVSSEHRDDSFDACRFIINHLKIKAPFWKKEIYKNSEKWVEQKESDLIKLK